MKNDVTDNIKEPSIWIRGLYMLLFAIFYSLAEIVLFAVVIFQFALKLFTGETNERLRALGQSFATYIYQTIQFLNFNSEDKPYPFAAWPKGEPEAVNLPQVSESESDSEVVVNSAEAATDEIKE